MAEIALDCGYPASSLKERVYALSGAAPHELAHSFLRGPLPFRRRASRIAV